jgi:hypothetical protein
MEGEEPLIDFHLAFLIGWVNSPPYLFAATENMCDLANTRIKASNTFKVRPLDDVLETLVPPEPPMPRSCDAPSKLVALPEAVGVPVADQATRPVASHDVHVDDFISMAQGNSKRRQQVNRSFFEALVSVATQHRPAGPPRTCQPQENAERGRYMGHAQAGPGVDSGISSQDHPTASPSGRAPPRHYCLLA